MQSDKKLAMYKHNIFEPQKQGYLRTLEAWYKMEEGMGFEPTVRCRTHAFQAGALNHSATPPYNKNQKSQMASRFAG